MKIIFFNVNDFSINPKGLEKYIKDHKPTTDVFCFQEIFENGKKLIPQILPEFEQRHAYKVVTKVDTFGQATLVKKDHIIRHSADVPAKEPNLGGGLYTEIELQGKSLHLVNFHGLSRPGEKLDTQERLRQSEKIIQFMADKEGTKIIGGDFNLFNKTESIAKFTEAGYIGLIEKYNIKNTRNEVVWKKYPETKQFFSDYVFIDGGVRVTDFQVPYTEVSDHLPMEVEFEI